MPLIELTLTREIDYETLKDYHASADGVYEIQKSSGESNKANYEFGFCIAAESEEDAKSMFSAYWEKLNDLGV